ncbi:hypothetical protein [Xanthomonas sp. XNM01]|uniref:hypothetical protein n=1 Tax=Xanthomonas sp. XNM01 TaxID=2769289 RepID=UPI001782202F|nr:hypothetical protein [Xanthomonas sp. XNM01]MBD9370045.1 hypothetical protein [Xanthomonas sp. XNM01]
MYVKLDGDVIANVAHISMVYGVRKSPDKASVYLLKIIFMGAHEYIALGTEDEMKTLYRKIRNAIDQLGYRPDTED